MQLSDSNGSVLCIFSSQNRNRDHRLTGKVVWNITDLTFIRVQSPWQYIYDGRAWVPPDEHWDINIAALKAKNSDWQFNVAEWHTTHYDPPSDFTPAVNCQWSYLSPVHQPGLSVGGAQYLEVSNFAIDAYIIIHNIWGAMYSLYSTNPCPLMKEKSQFIKVTIVWKRHSKEKTMEGFSKVNQCHNCRTPGILPLVCGFKA